MSSHRFFLVESKLFEVVHKAIKVQIVERSRGMVSVISMGTEVALWLCDVMLEVSELSDRQHVILSFWESTCSPHELALCQFGLGC